MIRRNNRDLAWTPDAPGHANIKHNLSARLGSAWLMLCVDADLGVESYILDEAFSALRGNTRAASDAAPRPLVLCAGLRLFRTKR